MKILKFLALSLLLIGCGDRIAPPTDQVIKEISQVCKDRGQVPKVNYTGTQYSVTCVALICPNQPLSLLP